MTTQTFSRLAGVIFAIVAIAQLARAIMGLEINVAATAIPVWPSWIAFAVAGALAWLGFTAAND